MFQKNKTILKKMPFQIFCDPKESKCAKNTHFYMEGDKKYNGKYFSFWFSSGSGDQHI